MASERELLETYLATLSDDVQENVQIETAERPVYHISRDKSIEKFIPIIGLRQHELEDRTVPRICVGPDLFGCISGYSAFYYDLMSRKAVDPKTEPENEHTWLGGYQIYGFNHEFALAPNDNLVPVASQTGERWLVNYSEKTREYVPILIGQLFATNINIVGITGDWADYVATAYLHVYHADGIKLDEHTLLKQGFYRFQVKNVQYLDRNHRFEFEEITSSDYLAAKKLSADLLSYEVPSFLNWR